jgi:DNA modification methylase
MNKIEFGDNREIMKRWATEGVKVQSVVTSPPYFGLRSYLNDDDPNKEHEIGLEEQFTDYLDNMIEVFSGVWDILADDGCVWVNLGDSYFNYRPGSGQRVVNQTIQTGNKSSEIDNVSKRGIKQHGFKEKELMGIPWRFAFKMQEAGWYLRQDIIWAKNGMPESVKDRCTRAHEYVFMFTKKPQYYYDNQAIKEPLKSGKPEVRNKKGEGYQADYAHGDRFSEGERVYGADGMANKRSVWKVNTVPYKGAHSAVFPPKLIEPMILATSRKDDIVFDPFMGSGTTAFVALQHGRKYLGCELNKEYEPLQQQRIAEATMGKPDAEVIDNLFDGL